NLFLSGISGRTGTTWVMRLIGDLLDHLKYTSIGESGFFVFGQFRNAPIEYFQITPGTEKNKTAYLNFFYKFVSKWAYDRRKIYKGGLQGLKIFVPKKAIKMSFENLKKELEKKETLDEIYHCFGNFYSNILNYHSLLQNNSLRWISKEPGYARHADDLYRLIPKSKNVVLVRDGRDVALSMKNRGWEDANLKRCILRWKTFTEMSLSAIEKVPRENIKLVKYEELVDNFQEITLEILEFYKFKPDEIIEEKLNDKNYRFKPLKGNYGKWNEIYTIDEKKFFEDSCSTIMEKLNYL
ncbi:MAG: sulfotransferase family protein, partial [Candidatus Heimdallarchaeaceae archaeon]